MATRVVRWNPLRDFEAIQAAMNRAMDDSRRPNGEVRHSLPVDVRENEDVYTIVASAPGVNADDITISLHDGVLNIALEIPATEADENERVLLNERFAGKLSRRIRLSQPVEIDAVEATFNAGLLTLTLPKAEEAKPRQIKVNGVVASENN